MTVSYCNFILCSSDKGAVAATKKIYIIIDAASYLIHCRGCFFC